MSMYNKALFFPGGLSAVPSQWSPWHSTVSLNTDLSRNYGRHKGLKEVIATERWAQKWQQCRWHWNSCMVCCKSMFSNNNSFFRMLLKLLTALINRYHSFQQQKWYFTLIIRLHSFIFIYTFKHFYYICSCMLEMFMWGLVKTDWKLLKLSMCFWASRFGGLVAVGLCYLDVSGGLCLEPGVLCIAFCVLGDFLDTVLLASWSFVFVVRCTVCCLLCFGWLCDHGFVGFVLVAVICES